VGARINPQFAIVRGITVIIFIIENIVIDITVTIIVTIIIIFTIVVVSIVVINSIIHFLIIIMTVSIADIMTGISNKYLSIISISKAYFL